MSKVNQAGVPVYEIHMWEGNLSNEEVKTVLMLLLDKLELEVWKTNATKHGQEEIQLRMSK